MGDGKLLFDSTLRFLECSDEAWEPKRWWKDLLAAVVVVVVGVYGRSSSEEAMLDYGLDGIGMRRRPGAVESAR